MNKIIIISLVLLSCGIKNENVNSQNLICDLYKSQISIYEPNVVLLDFSVLNNSNDTQKIHIKDIYQIYLLDSSFSSSFTYIINDEISDSIIINDYFPEVLFADSSEKLSDYYEQFIARNQNNSFVTLNNRRFYVLAPKSSMSFNVKIETNLDLSRISIKNSKYKLKVQLLDTSKKLSDAYLDIPNIN